MAEKPRINLVFIGHVDHGKSTLVGRVLYDSGSLSEQEYRRLQQEAEAKGRGTFAFAFVMDKLKEERERGITIDVSYKEFETPHNRFTIIDAPGHRDFVKNMITGASQADAAILVVAAKEGVMPQTKEHSFLAKVMGINQIIVAINKMDEVNYDKAKYEEVKKNVGKLLSSLGYKIDNIPFVPVSAWIGDNVVKKSDKLSWWTEGTFFEFLDKLEAPEQPIDKPLRIPIQDVYNIKGVGTVPVGRVETGVLRPGDKIVVMPYKKTGEVKTIEAHHQQLPDAKPGDNIGFNVRGIGKEDIRRGDVVGKEDNPPKVVDEFTAQIQVLDHPSAISVGYTPVFHLHTAQQSMKFVELVKKLDPRTGETTEENPKFLQAGDAAIVKIKPTQPLSAEKYSEFPSLGRFAIRDSGKTVAAGIITEIKEK